MRKKRRYTAAEKEEAKTLWIRGFSFDRITRLPNMPNRSDTILRWSVEEDWVGQLLKIAKRARERYLEKMAEELSDEDMEQMRLLLKLSSHIEGNLDNVELVDPHNLNLLATALDKNVKGRRLISGEVTERQENTLKFNLEDVIYATADADEDDDQIEGNGGEGLQEEIL